MSYMKNLYYDLEDSCRYEQRSSLCGSYRAPEHLKNVREVIPVKKDEETQKEIKEITIQPELI